MKTLLTIIFIALPSFVSAQELPLMERAQSIAEGIEALPEICNYPGSLYIKSIIFKDKLNRIIREAEDLEEIFIIQLVPYNHPARSFFNTRVFLFYAHQIDSHIDFSADPDVLQEQIESLSLSFKSLYNFSFQMPDELPENSPEQILENLPDQTSESSPNYSNWAQSLFQTFDCLGTN